ncbi:MAG: DUF4340 domain-containing protein [Bacteroidota bacterium]
MQKNRLIILAVAVLALAAVLLLISRTNSTFSKKDRNFAISDTANVTRVFMADMSKHSVLLEKVGPTQWTVNKNYKVRQDAINILLKTLLNVEVLEPVAKAGRNNVVKRLAGNSVKVEVYQQVYRIDLFHKIRLFPHEKLTKVYYVGSQTQDNLGTYMLLEGSEKPFITYMPGFRGFISIRYSPYPEDWREHTVFNYSINQIKSVEVDFMEIPAFSVKLENVNDRSFQLKSVYTGKVIAPYDTLKVIDFLTSFSHINFETLLNDLPKHYVDSIVRSKPFYQIVLTDKQDKKVVVKTYHKNNPNGGYDDSGNKVYFDQDRMYASINDGKDFVLIQFFVFDNILKPIDYFKF